jgi:hypothetical protein
MNFNFVCNSSERKFTFILVLHTFVLDCIIQAFYAGQIIIMVYGMDASLPGISYCTYFGKINIAFPIRFK